jgi:Flp pilus assembly pilin Flp
LEYVIVLTVIIAAIVIAAGGPIRQAVDSLMNKAATKINQDF